MDIKSLNIDTCTNMYNKFYQEKTPLMYKEIKTVEDIIWEYNMRHEINNHITKEYTNKKIEECVQLGYDRKDIIERIWDFAHFYEDFEQIVQLAKTAIQFQNVADDII